MSLRKRVLINVLLYFFLLFMVSLPASAFSDVSNHWAEKSISFLSAQQIVGGYADGSFRPDKTVTRAEFCKMIIKALRLDSGAYALDRASSSFRDVSQEYWAKGYIELAYELGIVKGDGPNSFRPEAGIRRVETATILVRTLGYEEGKDSDLDFRDAEQIPDWAHGYVAAAVERGLIKGFPDGTFRPDLNTTRAEAVMLIDRLLSRRGDRFQIQGNLQGVDPVGKRLRVSIENRDYFFQYIPALSIYYGERELDIEKLADAVPVEIALVLNKDGQVTYIETGVSEERKFVAFSGSQAGLENMEPPENSLFEQQSVEPFFSRSSTDLEPGRSMEINRSEMKSDELRDIMKVDGSGKVIAIIDTGIDPGHPDLAKTGDGGLKIIDWFDLTEEGRVYTKDSLQKGRERLVVGGKTYKIGNALSTKKPLRYGFLEESKLLRDIDMDGKMTGSYLVVLSCSAGEVYDTVHIDTDGDADLTDENPMKIYREQPSYFSFGRERENTYNFVIANIDPQGEWVNLGCDFNGHGTHVAGIAAANGRVEGVAPGAKIMSIKALDANGETDWSLLEQAIRYAAENGADVINLSLGYYEDKTAGKNSLTLLISNISKKYNVVFTIAVGNRGPGIASLATPGNARDAISVGAYISPQMWKELYGWEVESESLWHFSSIGPRKDGLMIPDVVAPGSAVSTAPMWSEDKYYMAEGTSMAAPHVAGAVTLLLESMEKMYRKPSAEEVMKAVSLGATPLEGYGPAEVGAGKLDMIEAWKKMLLVKKPPPLDAETYNRYLIVGNGLYTREYLPGKLNFSIFNNGEEELNVTWDTTADWMQPDFSRTKIVAGSRRDIPVSFDIPEDPGVYSAFLRGDVEGTYGHDLTVLATIIKPYILNKQNQYRIDVNDSLKAAQFKRYFFKVPPETGQLFLRLTVSGGEDDLKGRVRFHLINPDGEQEIMSQYAGRTVEGGVPRREVAAYVDDPEEGTWEVVVYSSAGLSSFGINESIYSLEVFLANVEESEKKDKFSSWFVTATPSDSYEEGGYITFHVLHKNSKKPVSGVLELRGKLYQVNEGRLTLKGVKFWE